MSSLYLISLYISNARISFVSVGTFSLYQALKTLGYSPYHMFEVVSNGATHLEIFAEAIECKYFGKGKPYGKAEFDKWLANHDVRHVSTPVPLSLSMHKVIN